MPAVVLPLVQSLVDVNDGLEEAPCLERAMCEANRRSCRRRRRAAAWTRPREAWWRPAQPGPEQVLQRLRPREIQAGAEGGGGGAEGGGPTAPASSQSARSSAEDTAP
ncbi:hypothetical protein C7M84_010883 [Penaeus vannamei]|uniref:Uncharacterized protein n=1 Tax=Penaeus vannamei TaxID=6689 RepID=A0A3R7M238_PENVA|nr:hypothetical protein C7M84_010883 [Penaeus vannamei]